jgi:4-amino-4-deoxy-L-arabinose transferase-like glycosyltransferase
MNEYAAFVRILAAGFLMGLACLTRGEAMFYMVAFLIITYCVAESRAQRFLYPVLLGVSCIAVVFPWCLRNRKIFGPGAGLSTCSGVNFYIAHNDQLYGYRSFNMEDSDIKGLDEISANESGFKLGLENIRKNPSGFLSDIIKGTFWLYAPCWYPVSWSTKAPYPTASYTGCYEIPLMGQNLFKGLSVAFYLFLLTMAVLSLKYFRTFPVKSWLYLLLIVLCNWFCFAVVFWGKGRYRFIIEVLLCILAGIALSNVFRPYKQLGLSLYRLYSRTALGSGSRS